MAEPFLIFPALNYDERQVIASTDTFPTAGDDGDELQAGDVLEVDTGDVYYWTGSAWKLVRAEQVAFLQLQVLIQIRDLLSEPEDGE